MLGGRNTEASPAASRKFCVQAYPDYAHYTYMLYFSTTTIDNMAPVDIENGIRKYAAKRHTSLDLKQASTYIKEDKYFLGLEGTKDLKLTRIRTPFERFFPKIIVSFPKNKKFEIYKIRYTFLSNVVFLILSILVVHGFFSLALDNNYFSSDFLLVLVFFLIFLTLTLLEIRLTKSKIRKAIRDYSTAQYHDRSNNERL